MILACHDPAWAAEFEELRSIYAAALGELLLRAEHVGSTAVPHLQAKPILDIDLVMEGYEAFPRIVEGLGRLGYAHQGDLGIRDREAFARRDETVPVTPAGRRWMPHHLYVCPLRSVELWRHIAFRDALRAKADLREEYERIKCSIAARSGDDRKLYAQIKDVECRPFVDRVLRAWPPRVPTQMPGAAAAG